MPQAQTLSVEIQEAIGRALTRTQSHMRGDGKREMMDLVLLGTISAVTQNFRAGGRPTKWRPLSPVTIASRRGGSSMPLMDTGMLYRSVTAGGKTGVQGSIRITEGLVLRYGTNVLHAEVHDPEDDREFTSIHPKRAKMLAIPLRPEARGKRPRDVFKEQRLFVIRSAAGNVLGVKRIGSGRNATIELWYLLKYVVNIPARRFLIIPEQDRHYIEQTLLSYLTVLLQKNIIAEGGTTAGGAGNAI